MTEALLLALFPAVGALIGGLLALVFRLSLQNVAFALHTFVAADDSIRRTSARSASSVVAMPMSKRHGIANRDVLYIQDR